MALLQIQEHLQGLYELHMEHCISDYLVTSREMLHGRFQQAIKSRETLLLYQGDDDLQLSVYLEEKVLDNLKMNGPDIDLHHGNIEDFCLALEGTSHFVYLIWNAMFERSVTMLEMEMQAEIDKFIFLSRYAAHRQAQPAPGQLRRLLFETISFQDNLTEQEVQRYRDANFYAEKYCWLLESRNFLNVGLEQELLKELRRFYRLNLENKLRRINRHY